MLEASAGGPYITIVSGTPSTYKEQLTSRSARSFARLCARAGPTISVAFTPYTGLLPICPETVYAPVQSGIPPPPRSLEESRLPFAPFRNQPCQPLTPEAVAFKIINKKKEKGYMMRDQTLHQLDSIFSFNCSLLRLVCCVPVTSCTWRWTH